VRIYRPVPFFGDVSWHRVEFARVESIVGRATVAILLVTAGVLIQLAVVPHDREDVVLLASVGLVIATARWAGVWIGVVTALIAAAMIDIVLLRPTGDLIVGSLEDIGALVLFLVVGILGAHVPMAVGSRDTASRVHPAETVVQAITPVERLTDRELVVLGMLAQGKSNGEIARELVVSQNTVKTHLSHVYGKLGVASRTQALVLARELGLVQ
jgi:DNA-binding CsgD family transcriptional regulator